MSRYIDIEPYEKDRWYLQKTYWNINGAGVKTTPLISVPTAEVEPIKHGRWINLDFLVCKCSVCDEVVYENGGSAYCPNCGARMVHEVDDLEIAHCENCKYEDTPGGMTNRQYLATLSNEELANTIYDVIVNRVGRRYNSSRLGVAQWLGELYSEGDFMKGFACYADNKKIMDGGENG